MSNPAELLIRGNPGKRRRGRNHQKGKPMATRRRRRKSAASITKRRAKRAARKAARKGKMPPGLAAWHAKNRGGKVARKARRSKRRGARSAKRRSRRRSRARSRRRMHALATVPRRIRRRRKGKSRASRRRARRAKRRSVRSNAGAALTLFSPFTSPVESVKDVIKGGLGGIAAAAGGASVAVVGGAFVSRITNGLLARFAPALLTNPVAARGVGALNFLLPAWAVAKWAPGISGRVRRGMLTGAAAAALVEAIRPGLVRDTFARLPIIGGVFGPSLSGFADTMGDYLAFGMSGANSNNGGAANLAYDENAGGMMDYRFNMRTDADRTVPADGGMNDYAMFGTQPD